MEPVQPGAGADHDPAERGEAAPHGSMGSCRRSLIETGQALLGDLDLLLLLLRREHLEDLVSELSRVDG